VEIKNGKERNEKKGKATDAEIKFIVRNNERKGKERL
jgi:hypothetical protein